MSELLLDRAGRRRSPATLPGFQAGHAPGNKGLRYPADPPKVEEIIAVMRTAGDGTHGRRLRGLIVIMWRAGLRIQEALALAEGDLPYWAPNEPSGRRSWPSRNEARPVGRSRVNASSTAIALRRLWRELSFETAPVRGRTSG